jgi:integrase
MLALMALQGLRTVEVQRASVEDLRMESGLPATMIIRGKARDRVIYLRPDVSTMLTEYLKVRGTVTPDRSGLPLFTSVSNRAVGRRISRRASGK